MADERKQCAHPGCTCMAAEDSDYCGAYCENAGKDEMEIACACGHEGCGV